MRQVLSRAAVCLAAALVLGTTAAAGKAPPRVDVRIVTDEADAVLAILAKRAAGAPVGDADWRRLFASDGYVRLKRREAAMKRAFEDADFSRFVLSDDLAKRAPALEATLARNRRADVAAAARRALAYLPPEAHIHAKIYLEIKPLTNSFVFDLATDPAIFIYLDPDQTRAKLENTLAHELHHIGYGTVYPPKAVQDEIAKRPKADQDALNWVMAFGEGYAMLAAAGGPRVHPHAVSKPEDRERWDRDVANFDADLRSVEAFFRDVLAGRLTDDQESERAGAFFGIQGPWYTVGWRMCVTIETTFGRRRLVEAFADPRRLLAVYNDAARRHNRATHDTLALWSDDVVEALAGTKK
jgi:putative zinc-dependent peptidase DUF5700